jgi:hypothetical protein
MVFDCVVSLTVSAIVMCRGPFQKSEELQDEGLRVCGWMGCVCVRVCMYVCICVRARDGGGVGGRGGNWIDPEHFLTFCVDGLCCSTALCAAAVMMGLFFRTGSQHEVGTSIKVLSCYTV